MSTPSVKDNSAILTIASLKLALKCGFLAALVAVVVVIFLPNYYTSEVKILPVDSKASGGLGQLAAAAASVGVGLPGGDSADANFADILASRTVLEDLLKMEFEFNIKSWRFAEERPYKGTLFDFLKARNMDEGVKKIGEILSASKDLKTKILSIKVETKSPLLSQQVAAAAARELERFVLERGRTKGYQKARFAEARLRESRVAMGSAEDTLRQFLEVNRGFLSSPDPTVRLTGTRLEAELKLRQQLVMTLTMNLETALLEEKNDVPIVNILDNANYPYDHSRPKRGLNVLLAFLLVSLGTWAWLSREWIRVRFIEADEDGKQAIPRKEPV